MTKADQKKAIRPSFPISWAAFQSYVRYLTTGEQQRIKAAFYLGRDMHDAQLRSSGEPYFTHCIAVGHVLADMNADAETIMAALLHDAVEDSPLTLEEVEKKFGSAVAALIDGVTKLRSRDLADKPTLDEKIETIRKIFTLMQEDVRMMMIKLVDRLHNMQTIEFVPDAKQKSKAQETMDVYVKIADRLCMQKMRDELEELCLNVLEPAVLQQLLRARTGNEHAAVFVMEKIQKKLESVKPHVPFRLIHETKPWSKLRAQLKMSGTAVTGFTALTIIFRCDAVSTCYRILGALHTNWRRESLSFQDFINSPMINGYRGLHTTIILEDGTRVRCKIRTAEMCEYARKGITTMCFDSEAVGILDYLPWAERISPLTEDTTDRSQDFWESLQSDILGNSITVHGMDDRVLLLPEGSTALDAAFYFLGEQALSLKAVHVNGEDVSFQTVLENGVTVEFAVGKHTKVIREWLFFVKTGIATAAIRSGLRNEPEEMRITSGRLLLQKYMTEKEKGLIEEFDPEGLSHAVHSLSLSSLDDACIAIAEGQLEPADVFGALFAGEEKNKTALQDQKWYIVRFSIKRNDLSALRKLLDTYPKYNLNLSDVRLQLLSGMSKTLKFFVKLRTTSKKIEQYKEDVITAGVQDVSVESRFTRWKYAALVAIPIILWGMDPVLAKILLIEPFNANPLDFTITRFAAFFCLCAINVIVVQRRSPLLYQRLPWADGLLWIAGLSFVLIALSTYVSLQYLYPHDYVTMASANAVMITLLNPFATRKISRKALLVGGVPTVLGLVLIKALQPEMSWIGYGAGLLMILSFSVFSIAVDEFKRRNAVVARYPFFLLILACITLFVSVVLFPFSTLAEQGSLIFLLFLYGIIITGIPYLLYYKLLLTKCLPIIVRCFPFCVLLTIAVQYMVFGPMSPITLIPFALVSTSGFLFYRYYSYPTKGGVSMK
jgi:RelA/SpoT family (p)ppGpp synthetase